MATQWEIPTDVYPLTRLLLLLTGAVALLAGGPLTDDEQWDDAFELLREMEEDYPEDALLLSMLGTVAGEVEARGLARGRPSSTPRSAARARWLSSGRRTRPSHGWC